MRTFSHCKITQKPIAFFPDYYDKGVLKKTLLIQEFEWVIFPGTG